MTYFVIQHRITGYYLSRDPRHHSQATSHNLRHAREFATAELANTERRTLVLSADWMTVPKNPTRKSTRASNLMPFLAFAAFRYLAGGGLWLRMAVAEPDPWIAILFATLGAISIGIGFNRAYRLLTLWRAYAAVKSGPR